MRKTALRMLSILCIVLVLVGGSSFSVSAKATSIRISVNQITIQPNGTYQLSVTLTPANSSGVKWSSSNTSVATVNGSGLVKGVGSGTATITVTITDGSNLSASCNVTVSQLISSLSLNPSSMEIYTGSSKTITANISPSNASNKSLKWTSTNTGVATVSNGTVKAVAPGTATITAATTDGSKKSASCVVTVKQGVTSLSLNKTSATLGVGNSTQLTVTVQPGNASNKSVSWSSSNSGVASVNSSGLVTAKAAGTATITVKSNDGTNKSASCTITVKEVATPTPTPTPTNPTTTTKPRTPTTTKPAPPATTTKPTQPTATQPNTTVETTIEPVTEPSTEPIPETTVETSTGQVAESTTEAQAQPEPDKFGLSVSQKKKNSSITVSWNNIDGATKYQVFVACSKDKKHEFVDTDYYLVGETTDTNFAIRNYDRKTYYSVYVVAEIPVNDPADDVVSRSEVSAPVVIKTKGMGFILWFISLFIKRF